MTVGEDLRGAPAEPAAEFGLPGAKRRKAGPQRYDFRRPNKLGRDHVRALQIVNETFGRQVGTLLTTTLRVACQMNLVSVEQLSYDEYIRSLEVPSLSTVLSAEPLAKGGIFNVSTNGAMLCIDHLLGGTGTGPQPKRPLTQIESGILRGLMERALHELSYAFESLLPVQTQLLSLEENPQFAQVASASDTMIVASFDLRLGSHDTVATLCLPLDTVFPVLEASAARGHGGGRADDGRAVGLLRERLRDVPVEVSVRFRSVSLSPREVLGLVPGDVLPLHQPISEPLVVSAGGVATAHAVPGSVGKRLACLIVEPPAQKESQR